MTKQELDKWAKDQIRMLEAKNRPIQRDRETVDWTLVPVMAIFASLLSLMIL